ncbi:hypothetical protein CUN61_23605 [Pseudomonas arsenicoxydans]|uniref:Uncharacterized protein n=1 Tax=Pseudomonas arsenicoxydans TaxID=702115 RepID=A0A4P6G5I4_9PSED|nr:hypothetical protein CUN61_23605 [Pseudomonas arsenicoxydans]
MLCTWFVLIAPGLIVPTLCVVMPLGTLRVPAFEGDAERPGLHSHAEHGNDLNHCSGSDVQFDYAQIQ